MKNRFQQLLLKMAGAILRLMFATCRVKYSAQSLAKNDAPDKAIGVTWHRGAIYALYFYAPLKPAILVSRSKDGQLLAGFISQMGGLPVRGSSSKGGVAALKSMLSIFKSNQASYAATVADGPRGPRYQAKEGMIILAMKSGLPLYPLMWSCKRAWVFSKTWDKTMLPKPFATIWVENGQPIYYPRRMSKPELETARLQLQQKLEEMRLRLDKLSGYQEPIGGKDRN